MPRLVYRGGSARDENLTPRAGKDTQGKPGQAPGFSVFSTLDLAVEPGGKAQAIDLDLLLPPLVGLEDDCMLEGGREGHVSITPVTESRRVDQVLLEAWASSRGAVPAHPLTEIVKQALVQTVRRPR